MTWEKAQEFCEASGARLVSLEGSKKYSMIIRYILNNNLRTGYWLGGKHVNNTWIWTNNKEIVSVDLWDQM